VGFCELSKRRGVDGLGFLVAVEKMQHSIYIALFYFILHR
jgi:hypothetical protein